VGAPAVDGEAVAARLRELGAAAKAPVEALEPALSAILEATGVTAAAVCLYDPRYELLRLAAEVGLSDEGCQRLRTVRRGGVAGWDMPLHSLLNRRAYLIGNAAQNRYVPALVDSAKPVRAVACLPLYSGSVPAGSLVLVTVAVRPFGEGEIRALEQPLRELGKLIEAVRRQASEAASARSAVSALAAEGDAEPPPDVPDAAGVRPARSASAAERDAARLTSLAAALATAQREQARLERELERLRATAPREDARVVEQTVEIDRLRARLAEAEAGAAHEQRVRE